MDQGASIMVNKILKFQKKVENCIFFGHILYPQCYKSLLLEYITDIVIIDPTITL